MLSINNKLQELGYKPLFEEEKVDSNFFENLSKKIGYQIPEDYQQFLLDFPKTGTFTSLVETVATDKPPTSDDGYLYVNLLFARCICQEIYDLLSLPKLNQSVIPSHLLVIGESAFGDCFCIDLEEKQFGKVFFLDSEEFIYNVDTGEVSGIYLVATNFSAFIQSIRNQEVN